MIPPLIIDSNERGRLVEAIERRAKSRVPRIDVARQHLVNGDYKCGDWLIESKSIADLIQSKFSGHLNKQLDNMDANAGNYGVVVHGSIKEYVKGVNERAAIYNKQGTSASAALKLVAGICARIVADFGCLLYRADKIDEVAAFMVALHEKTYKKASRHGAKAIKRVSSNDVRIDMLLTIPGIGPEMAESIIKTCGSIEEAAFQDTLRNVPRLGKVLRNRIVEVLTSEEEVRVER